PESDVLYLYSEYGAEAEPAIHAAAIRSRADWIPGLIDPSANGRNQADGYQSAQDVSGAWPAGGIGREQSGVGNSACVATNAFGAPESVRLALEILGGA